MGWPNSGECHIDDHHVYYAGNEDVNHYNGVAFIVTTAIQRTVKTFVPVSDRVALLQLNSKPFNINIIQTYAPTGDYSDEVVEAFYDQIQKALNLIKKSEITIIMGDFNAKIGSEPRDDIVGGYGLGIANERGDRLFQFCQEMGFVISNTFFQLPPRRLYTWTSNAHTPEKIVRNQIDYVLINKRYRNCIKSVKTYPGADMNSDHNPLVANIRMTLKRCTANKNHSRPELTKLNNPTMLAEVRNELDSKLNRINIDESPEVETVWTGIREAFISASSKLTSKNAGVRKKAWITDEIIKMMEERRLKKGHPEYLRMNREIKNKIRIAKENWLNEQCNEIEQLEAKYDSFNLHKKIKEAAGVYKPRQTGILLDNQGNTILDVNNKAKQWCNYIENLFQDERSDIPEQYAPEGLDITKEEIQHAISLSKNRKAAGPDGIYSEVIKILKNEESLNVIMKLFNMVYRSGVIPSDWLKSTFVTLPKKRSAKRCSDYRLISLMSHFLKIFLKIIHKRIYAKCESFMDESQFGFRNGFGTREVLFSIQVLVQRCRDVSTPVYACFIDYEKAFDRVQHEKLMKILTEVGLEDRDLTIISNLYWNQTAQIKVDQQITEEIQIKRGVRQGCILSPLLFNIYSNKIFEKALENCSEGILINGVNINNLRYADDTVIIADSLEGLQILLNQVAAMSVEFGLKLNTNKTKWMLISRNSVERGILQVQDQQIERVQSYKYLGCQVNEKWDSMQEVRARIEQARASFVKMKSVLCCRGLSLSVRTRVLRCYVFSILYYGIEAWTLTDAMSKKLEAFEMWTYRRMLRISWMDRVRNEDVLARMSKDLEVMFILKKRKLEYFGHILRNDKYGLLKLIIEGKIAGRRGPGRRRTSWLKNLRQWFGESTTSLFRKAVDKVQIALMIANVRKGHGT